MNYTLTVTFSTDEDTDEHLQTPQEVEDEITSWLESLKATVQAVTVHVEGKP